MDVFALFCRFF